MPRKQRKPRKEKTESPSAVRNAVRKERPVPLKELRPVADKAAPLVVLSQRPRAIIVFFCLGLVVFFLLGLILIAIGQFKPTATYFRPAFPWILTILGIFCCMPALVALIVEAVKLIKTEETKLAAGFGAIFLVVLLIVVLIFPNLTESSALVVRVVLALSAACVGAALPGIFDIKNRLFRATSASAFFAAVFFFNPGTLSKLIRS